MSSVYFNFTARDFYNALDARDNVELRIQLFRFFMGTLIGTPVFVFSRYGKVFTPYTLLSHTSAWHGLLYEHCPDAEHSGE